MARERRIRPGVDFPISALPVRVRVDLRSNHDSRERAMQFPTLSSAVNLDGRVLRGEEIATEWMGRAGWSPDSLEALKNQWIENWSRDL